MATPAQTKYQRLRELARQRGYASPYAMRKASMERRGVKRDYALERERSDIRANAEGFRNRKERAQYRREAASQPTLNKEQWQKQKTLSYFGISERRFNAIRRENKLWAREYPMLQWTAINTYNIDIDMDTHNWSEQRVGYILSFFAAVVNPKTNYDSLTKGRKRIYDKNGKKRSNKSQFYYLVKYTNLMQVDEFESRYGKQIVKDAKSGKVEV
jgi:hypothetical protein